MLSDYTPMAPTLVREPFHRDGWIYEEKVDGWRIVAYKDGVRMDTSVKDGWRESSRRRPIAGAVRPATGRRIGLVVVLAFSLLLAPLAGWGQGTAKVLTPEQRPLAAGGRANDVRS
jgi:hypothetical protein